MKRSSELINKLAAKSLSASEMVFMKGGGGDEVPIPPKDGSPAMLKLDDGTTTKGKKG